MPDARPPHTLDEPVRLGRDPEAIRVGATMVADSDEGALIITFWPSFPLVLAALVVQGITGRFLG